MRTGPVSPLDANPASVVIRTARAALDLSAEDMAAAAGCDAGLIERIESGDHDPVMDTVERLLNSVGLEMRCGPRPASNPQYREVSPQETRRIAAAIAVEQEFWARYDRPSPRPGPGTRLEWDGHPPAPPRLFGAGPGRRHEGGWGAILMKSLLHESGMTDRELASTVGVEIGDLVEITVGDHRPPMSRVQRMMSAAGRALHVRIEVYDDHDDGLHQPAMADPDAFDRTISRALEASASATLSGS